MERSYTCISCGLTFENSESQKEHYKSDWHRFNLNRRVSGLPGVTEDVYESHVLSQQEAKPEGRYRKFNCDVCSKTFSSEKAFDQHTKSKKHIERIRATHGDKDGEMPEQPMEQNLGDALGLTECLFCRHKSRSFAKSMQHMIRIHSLFIPDVEYMKDLRGLVNYLGEKVGVGRFCLWCDRSFESLEAVQKHMVDSSHCKLRYEENEEEYLDYYDFTEEEPAIEESSNGGEDEEWEDLESDGEGEEKPASVAVVTASGELMLGNGQILGHRELKRYYKQEQGPMLSHTPIINRLLYEYKALGWRTEEIRAQGVERKKALQKQQRIGGGRKSRFDLKVGVKANKLQKFFREQL